MVSFFILLISFPLIAGLPLEVRRNPVFTVSLLILLMAFFIGWLILPTKTKKKRKEELKKQEAQELKKYISKREKERLSFEQKVLEEKNLFEQEESRNRNVYEQEEDEKWELAMSNWQKENSRWERAMSRWEKTYYCERDDIVFIIGTNEHEDSGKLQEFLYY